MKNHSSFGGFRFGSKPLYHLVVMIHAVYGLEREFYQFFVQALYGKKSFLMLVMLYFMEEIIHSVLGMWPK